jgi:hypothetical protein
MKEVRKMSAKFVMWSNYDVKPDKKYYDENYPEMSEDQRMEDAIEVNYQSLDYLKSDMDIQLSNNIIAIADIGRWNGRVLGYKMFESGNIKDIFNTECDYAEWFSDGYNVKFKGSHHDGNNYCEYREVRDNVNIDTFLNKIYKGEKLTRKQINYYTKSILPEVLKAW